jgi:predicted phosphoribosyltransferase
MKLDLRYRNRTEAGRILAAELAHYKSKPDVVVLGLTWGGGPVAAEVASALQASLEVRVVRNPGAPFQPELAMGAIAGDGTQVLDKEIVQVFRLTDKHVHAVIAQERTEQERRERLYRGSRPPLDLKDHAAFLVDDGLAPGSTMLAAVAFARRRLTCRAESCRICASKEHRSRYPNSGPSIPRSPARAESLSYARSDDGHDDQQGPALQHAASA